MKHEHFHIHEMSQKVPISDQTPIVIYNRCESEGLALQNQAAQLGGKGLELTGMV